VPGRFSFLSRFGVKFVEVAGAGLASAACAYFLGQIGQQPPAPPPAIVQVMPSEDAMRMARDDHALLAALVRKETESRKDSESRKNTESGKDTESQAKPEASAPGVAAPKPAKPLQAAQARRSQKPEQAAASEPQLRASEPLAIQPPLAAANAAPKPAVQSPMPLLGRDGFATTAPSAGEEERPLLARLRQIPSWFLPENERVFGNVPRPPMPVGEFLPSAM
jgi:hypothetical protein